MLKQLVVLKLNCNRLGEECTFNPRRMIEKNVELYKAITDPQRGSANAAAAATAAATTAAAVGIVGGQVAAATAAQEAAAVTAMSAYELFPFIQVCGSGSGVHDDREYDGAIYAHHCHRLTASLPAARQGLSVQQYAMY